jgi:hypothetical protein
MAASARTARRLLALPPDYKFARRARRQPTHCIVFAPPWAVPPWRACCGSQRQVRRVALKARACSWRLCPGCQHKAHLNPALRSAFPAMGVAKKDLTLR